MMSVLSWIRRIACGWLPRRASRRLGRQAGWALPMSIVWIAAESARGWRAMTLDPVRDGGSGWPHLTVTSVFRTFLLVAPVTIPAGLALAALLCAWRIYAATTEAGGWLASALVTAEAGQAPAAQVPAAQAPVTLPAPRREAVPVALHREGILGPGVRR
jgi:hypothetical protein